VPPLYFSYEQLCAILIVNAGKNKLPGVPQLSGHVVVYMPEKDKSPCEKIINIMEYFDS
jgi:hypothetical protein